MKKIIDYINEIKDLGYSDYAIAKKINIKQPSLIAIKKGGNIKDETAIKIAELLDINKSEVLIAAAVARSKGKVKEEWLKLANKLNSTALRDRKKLALIERNLSIFQRVNKFNE